MKSRKFRKSSRLIFRIIGLTLSVVVLGFILMKSPEIIQSVKQFITPSVLPPGRWQAKTHTTHLFCGHAQIIRDDSKTADFFKEAGANHGKNPNFEVRTNEHLIIYRVKKNDWCNSCRRNRFLGIQGENVAVLRGTPLQPGPVQEIININAGILPDSERNDLIRGIPFANEREKLEVLEGLSGLISD